MSDRSARRVLGEIAIISVGILLALGVDACWGWYQDRNDESEYLSALEQELDVTLPQLTRTDSFLTLEAKAAEALLSQFSSSSRAPEDSLLWWLAEASRVAFLDPPRAALDDALSSEATRVIRDSGLRRSIGSYDNSLSIYARQNAASLAVWTDMMRPFLLDAVPRTERLRRGPYGAGRTLPFPPSAFRSDFDRVLGSPAFESMLAERWMRIDQEAQALAGVRESIVQLQELLRSEGSR